MLQNNDRHLLNTCVTKVSHFLGPLPPVEHNVVYGMVENLYQIVYKGYKPRPSNIKRTKDMILTKDQFKDSRAIFKWIILIIYVDNYYTPMFKTNVRNAVLTHKRQ